MNLTYRKLAMLENDLKRKEEIVKKDVCYMTFVDRDLQERVTNILDKYRMINVY